MSYIQEIISIKCFLYASIQKMYRIINAAILYWFYERSILNFKKKTHNILIIYSVVLQI